MHTDTNVLRYLESSALNTPHAVAVVEGQESLTYAELAEQAKRVGSELARRGARGHAVVIAMEKGIRTLCVMMGALYAGGYYVPVDIGVPEGRMEYILDVLECPLVVLDRSGTCIPDCANWYEQTMDVADLMVGSLDEALLHEARCATLADDPAYVMFTSGSTGVPKGVAISHRAIRCFIDAFVAVLEIRADDRIGNQAPFDFDVSTKDIYSAFATGAALVIVPRELFMQPLALMAYLSEQRVTVLIWAVAALCIVSAYHSFNQLSLPDLRIVAFSGEAMPWRHLREWFEHVAQATFYNLYGPTEITCNCLYLRLDSHREYKDGVPLGSALPHCDVLLIDSEGEEVRQPGVPGEIVVRGPSLALGYVGACEQTRRAFTQNPLHERFPDRVYHTGDLAVVSERGELYFHGRKDNQIKHMGHRIELEEIDLAVEKMPKVRRCRCVYDSRRRRLRAYYEGDASEVEVRRFVAGGLPFYMRPSTVRRVSGMPLNKNGKVDRAQLLEQTYRMGSLGGE